MVVYFKFYRSYALRLSFPGSSVGMQQVTLCVTYRWHYLYLYISIVFNRRLKAGLLVAAQLFFNLVG